MPLPGLPTGPSPPSAEALWRLTKDRRVAVCWQSLHPRGFELRVVVNGDTLRSTVERTADDAREQSAYMRSAMLEMGWQEPT